MNHGRILRRSKFTICDLSSSVSVSRIESRNCEKRLILWLIIACRGVVGGDAFKNSFDSNKKL